MSLRLRALLTATVLAVGLSAPAANAAVNLDPGGIVKPAKPPKIIPFDDGCLFDDPSSCGPEEPVEPVEGPIGNPPGSGQLSYCDSYRDALGSIAGTPFGMKQLEALGC